MFVSTSVNFEVCTFKVFCLWAVASLQSCFTQSTHNASVCLIARSEPTSNFTSDYEKKTIWKYAFFDAYFALQTKGMCEKPRGQTHDTYTGFLRIGARRRAETTLCPISLQIQLVAFIWGSNSRLKLLGSAAWHQWKSWTPVRPNLW